MSQQPIFVPYLLLGRAAELIGYSKAALEQKKIARGQWVEGREYVVAPDGRRLVSLAASARWVEQGRK